MDSDIPYKRLVLPPSPRKSAANKCITASAKTLASVIATIKLGLIFVCFLMAIKTNYGYHIKDNTGCVFLICLFYVNALVLYAHHKKQPYAYLPYLIVHTILNVLYVTASTLILASVIYVLVFLGSDSFVNGYGTLSTMLVVGFVTQLLYTVVEIWCFFVVYQAWLEMRMEKARDKIENTVQPKIDNI